MEGSLGIMLRDAPVGGPVAPVVLGDFVGRGHGAGVGAAVATPVVSQHLWSAYITLVLAL